MRKKFIRTCCLLITALCLFFCPAYSKAEENTIVLLTWPEYLPDWLIDQFCKETGIKVKTLFFTNSGQLQGKMAEYEGMPLDLLITPGETIGWLIHNNYLQPFDKQKLPQWQDIDPAFLGFYSDPDNKYTIPFQWGYSGFLLDSTQIDPQTITSYDKLWSPEVSSVVIPDDLRTIMSYCLRSLGYSCNDNHGPHLQQAFDRLKLLMNKVVSVEPVIDREVMNRNQAGLAICWSGDGHKAAEADPSLKFVVPQGGPIIWLNNWAIHRDSRNWDSIYAFLNFCMRPEISRRFVEETGYCTASLQVRQMVQQTTPNSSGACSLDAFPEAEFERALDADTVVILDYWLQKLALLY